MITELYVFTPSSYVVADEWNANFRVLDQANVLHAESVTDAYNKVAFPNSDLTGVFNSVKSRSNSYLIEGDSVKVSPEYEYYKVLSSDEDLNITIPTNTCANVRIVFSIPEDRALALPPFTIKYTGTKIENIGDITEYKAGTYFMFIYETNGVAQIKLVKTGV